MSRKPSSARKKSAKKRVVKAERTARGTFAPGNPGGPGRPAGSRNRTTELVEALLDGEAASLTRTLIKLARRGNPTAMSIVFQRLAPPRRDRPIKLALPKIETTADLLTAHAAIVAAAAEGEITPAEAASLTNVLDLHRRAIDSHLFAERIAALEARLAQQPSAPAAHH